MGNKPYEKWTLVQHSGYGRGGKYEFKKAVEVCHVGTAAKARRIEAEGGVIYDDYRTASEAEYAENYPETNPNFLIPRVEGSFSKKKHDGLRIYVPHEPAEQEAKAA